MEIQNTFIVLRTGIRKNIQKILDFIQVNYISSDTSNKKEPICMFCGINKSLTKEHVLPKWIFEGDTDTYFITTINNSEQTYNKTTISACSSCNHEILSSIEKYIKGLFVKYKDDKSLMTIDEKMNVMRWLELIGYKFQIIDIQRCFIKHSDFEFIPYLKDIPIAIISTDDSEGWVVSKFRKSLKHIKTKKREKYLNSLIVFHSENPGFHFFHKTNEFIFLELPIYKIALFYFLNKTFSTPQESYIQSIDIIKNQYTESKNPR